MLMTQYYYNKSILDSTAQVIVHQVNCLGVMGSGLAAQVKKRFPTVFEEYARHARTHTIKESLGTCLIVPIPNTSQYVANIFAQARYGNDKNVRYTSYDAFDMAMRELREWCEAHNVKTIAFPHGIGCGKGNACWMAINSIIDANFRSWSGSAYYYNVDEDWLKTHNVE